MRGVFLVALLLLVVMPVIELWVAVRVAAQIGAFPTVLALMALSASGVWLLRRQGVSVWRSATAELAAGRTPTRQLLDGALVLVGGVSLMAPGFVTGAFGALLMLPPVRAVLRPLLLAWMTARAARLARSGRFRTVVVGTTIDAQGRPTGDAGVDGVVRDPDVIDAEGWDVGPQRGELPGDRRGPGHGRGPGGSPE